MDRNEIKEKIDELMRQYEQEEIDGNTYALRMMQLTALIQDEID